MTEPSLLFMLVAALGLVPGAALQSAPSPAAPISLGEANQSGGQAARSSTALVEQFQTENALWRQFTIGKEIVERRDPRVLPILAAWLNHEDRHVRGNVAFIFAVPILIPLLKDKEINAIVPWALGQIGDKSAVGPLIETLDDDDPSMRVLSIYALETLNAKEALPRLTSLLADQRKSNFGAQVSVAQAAEAAIAKLK